MRQPDNNIEKENRECVNETATPPKQKTDICQRDITNPVLGSVGALTKACTTCCPVEKEITPNSITYEGTYIKKTTKG